MTSDTAKSNMPCELVTWDQVNSFACRLAKQVRAAGIEIDMIVAIGRGGYMPARLLSDLLGIMNLASFKIEHYRGSHKSAEAVIKYPLVAEVNQQNILLVDDVSDSGDTFTVAIDHIRSKGTPQNIHTAVLHHKSVSRYEPDYFAEEVKQWRWIIYPWAVTEDLSVLIGAMGPEPVDVTLIQKKLFEKHGIEPSLQQIQVALTLITEQQLSE